MSDEPKQVSKEEYSRRCRCIIRALNYGGLEEAFHSYIHKNRRQMLARGLKGNNPLEVLTRTAPDKGFPFLLDYLKTIASGEVDKFLAEGKGATREDLGEMLHCYGAASSAELGKAAGDKRRLALLYLDAWLHGDKYAAELHAADGVNAPKANSGSDSRDAFLEALPLIEDPLSMNKIRQDADQLRHLEIMLTVFFGSLRFATPAVAELVANSIDRYFKSTNWEQRDMMRKEIANIYEQHRVQGSMPARRIVTAKAGQLNDVEKLEVLTQCSVWHSENAEGKPSVAFSDALAAREFGSDEWLELDKDEAVRLFPPRGRIVHFDGNMYPTLPFKNECAVYQVKAHNVKPENVDRHDKIHAERRMMPVQVIASLEDIGLADISELRTKLRDLATDERDHEYRERIIHLKDGTFARPREGLRNLAANDFKDALPAWGSLRDIIQMASGRNFHLGELPDTERYIDLGLDFDIVCDAIESHNNISPDTLRRMKRFLETAAQDERTPELLRQMQMTELDWPTDNVERVINELCARPEVAQYLEALDVGHGVAEEAEVMREQIKEQEQLFTELDSKHEAFIKRMRQRLDSVDEKVEKRFFERRRSRLLRAYRNQEERFQGVHKSIPEMISQFEKAIEAAAQKIEEMQSRRKRLIQDAEKELRMAQDKPSG